MEFKILGLLLCVVVSAPVFAADRIAQIAAANPSATPYQVLQKFYNESSNPAEITDFDLNTNKKSNQHCAAAETDSQAPYELFVVRAEVVTKPGIPAQPARGPLFPATPGTPDQTIPTLLCTTDSRNALDDQAKDMATKSKITTTQTDLNWTMKDPQNSESVIVLSVRRNDGMLALKATLNAGTKKESTIFAYCYRQN